MKVLLKGDDALRSKGKISGPVDATVDKQLVDASPNLG